MSRHNNNVVTVQFENPTDEGSDSDVVTAVDLPPSQPKTTVKRSRQSKATPKKLKLNPFEERQFPIEELSTSKDLLYRNRIGKSNLLFYFINNNLIR